MLCVFVEGPGCEGQEAGIEHVDVFVVFERFVVLEKHLSGRWDGW